MARCQLWYSFKVQCKFELSHNLRETALRGALEDTTTQGSEKSANERNRFLNRRELELNQAACLFRIFEMIQNLVNLPSLQQSGYIAVISSVLATDASHSA